MRKVRKDGRVAVLYSPGYGCGWSTDNEVQYRETLCMDARIVQAVLDGDIDRACAEAKRITGAEDLCILGAKELRVEWVPRGWQFNITEFDGYESVVAHEPPGRMTA